MLKVLPKYYNNLILTEEKIWSCLKEGSEKKNLYFNLLSLVTNYNNNIKVRTLVLRDFNKKTKTLSFFTDFRSNKVKAIESNPKVKIHTYDPIQKIQIQISGKAKLNLKNNLTKKYYDKLSIQDKLNYITLNKPGKKISNPKNISYTEHKKAHNNFCIILVTIIHIEWLLLNRTGNRRAIFSYYKNKISKSWQTP